MKRQITEIEREIVERSNRQTINVNSIEENSECKKNINNVVDPSDIDLESLDPLSKYLTCSVTIIQLSHTIIVIRLYSLT